MFIFQVHYSSLDVEGVELDVLKCIPWDKVDIKQVFYSFFFQFKIISTECLQLILLFAGEKWLHFYLECWSRHGIRQEWI